MNDPLTRVRLSRSQGASSYTQTGKQYRTFPQQATATRDKVCVCVCELIQQTGRQPLCCQIQALIAVILFVQVSMLILSFYLFISSFLSFFLSSFLSVFFSFFFLLFFPFFFRPSFIHSFIHSFVRSFIY